MLSLATWTLSTFSTVYWDLMIILRPNNVISKKNGSYLIYSGFSES